MKFMFSGVLIFIQFFCINILFAQDVRMPFINKEGWSNITDTTIKKEIGSIVNECFTQRVDSIFPSLHKMKHSSFGKTFIAFKENKFNIRIETADFDSTKHHLEYSQKELI